MKNLTLLFSIAVLLLTAVSSCKKKIRGCTDPNSTNYNAAAEENDGSCTYPIDTTGNDTTRTLTGNISANKTLTADKVWLIQGFVYVKSGVTITIEAGTVIKGDKPTKGTLIIERGAKISAVGTASSPIVFTSNQEAGSRSFGDWGGIILCGKAKNNLPGGEGLLEGGTGAYYGGTDDADNSGIMQYVRIEFAGIPYQPNQEINGLTLGSVGSGTVIDHIQVSYCGDDSYEWFGGTVNAKYIVSFSSWDDDFDTDQGYSGKVQFVLAKRNPDIADASGSNGFESDNSADGTNVQPFTTATFSNATILGPKQVVTDNINGQFLNAIHLRRNTRLKVHNSVFTGFPYGLHIQNTFTEQNATANLLAINNTIISGCDDTVVTDLFSAFNPRAWFDTPAFGNSYIPAISSLQITAPFATMPNFLPEGSSPLNAGASFSASELQDAFFQPVNYKGAFGSTDWTSGWVNWDPQNTVY